TGQPGTRDSGPLRRSACRAGGDTMGRRRQTGGRSSGERPPRDGLGGHRPRLRAAAKPPAVWAGVDRPQPAPYLAPTLEQEMLTLAEARRGDGAGVIFGYAGRDETGPFVVAVRVVPFAQVEPLEGGVRVPRPSWWALHQAWQAEFPDLEPVGWFRIQPGRGTALGSYDRFTAYQRFADPLQFTWVLDPQRGRQAFYVWEGSDLVPLPGYWPCTQPPQVPPRPVARTRHPPAGSSGTPSGRRRAGAGRSGAGRGGAPLGGRSAAADPRPPGGGRSLGRGWLRGGQGRRGRGVLHLPPGGAGRDPVEHQPP